jgi:hypothetical protein
MPSIYSFIPLDMFGDVSRWFSISDDRQSRANLPVFVQEPAGRFA